MLVNHNINNLNGGISTQPIDARYDSQCEDMINFTPTISNGLRKRNPLVLVINTASNFSSTMKTHSYDRGDGLEKYGMILDGNGLKVFTSNGVSKTVTNLTDGAESYITKWAGTNWSKDIQFLTVGDTTWILNRNIVTAMTSATSSENTENYCFYWIKRTYDASVDNTNGYNYILYLDGVAYTATNQDSTAAINSLTTLVAAAGYTVVKIASIMRISRATAFTFSYGDSYGNQASFGWSRSVQKLTDLPADMKGFTTAQVGTVSVTGTDRDSFTGYYVKWNEDGYWTETIAEGLQYEIDYTTMPLKVVRQSDGSFAVGWNKLYAGYDGFVHEWSDRAKGDDDSNPLPSFIGRKLSNMFFFKNRLGFTSEENVILSEAGSYYNFFATTVMDIIDSDPIDASADSDTVSIIRNVNAVAGSITLWADNSQFVLSGGEILSPATTRISQTSGYYCDSSIPPVVLDSEIVFFNKVGLYMDVMSYSPASINTDRSSAESISSHVVGLLPNTITKAEVASAYNMMFLLDGAYTNTIYCYRYHINSNQKVMSSWFKWTFNSHIVKDINVLNNKLYVLMDTNTVSVIDLSDADVTEEFLDFGSEMYESKVELSRFNVQTRSDTKMFREPMYYKSVLIRKEGNIDLEIKSDERASGWTVLNKHLGRRIFVGGSSNTSSIIFKSSYATGCKLDTISVEGVIKTRSRNV